MAKRAFMTGAMIIAAGAVTTATSAASSGLTDTVYRGTGQPAVSSIIRLDEDITALGGFHINGEILTLAAQQGDTLSMAPIIVNPGGGVAGGADSLTKPPAGPAGQDSLTKPPAVQGIRQDTLRPPVVPRVRRTVPKTAVPSGPNKP
ncbi:MAG: hypothetical protein O7I42_24175 [Alphaproteobacteria bacterium]|nr:hypothetical protein [Alphaproteobacteria bacterium]